MRYIDLSYIFAASMSPALNRSFALQRFKRGNMVKLHNEIRFDFYPELPHIYVTVLTVPCMCCEDHVLACVVNQRWFRIALCLVSKHNLYLRYTAPISTVTGTLQHTATLTLESSHNTVSIITIQICYYEIRLKVGGVWSSLHVHPEFAGVMQLYRWNKFGGLRVDCLVENKPTS